MLIIYALLLLVIGLETKPPVDSNTSPIKQSFNIDSLDTRPNIEKVMTQLYPM